MLRLEQIAKDHREAGALHAHLNLFGFWDDHAFITKSGDVGLVLRVRGVDYESLDSAQRDHAVKRLEAALRRFDERTRVYQILFKRNRPQIKCSSHPNPIVQSAIEQRQSFLENWSEHLYQIEIFFVLVREASRTGSALAHALTRLPKDVLGGSRELAALFRSDKTKYLLAEDIEAHRRDLDQRARSFQSELADLTEIEILDSRRAFNVLYRLVNLDQTKIESVIPIDRLALDRQLSDSELEAHKGYLRLNDRFLKVLTLKESPSETWPLILKSLLEVRGNFTVVSEWKAIDNGKARKLIQSRRRHFHNSKTSFLSNLSTNEHKGPADELIDDSKQAAITELGHCLEAIGHEGKYFGEFSLSIVAHADDLKEVERLQPEFIRAFSAYDGALLDERYNLLNAFFATVPGNAAFNLRRQYLLNSNYADLSFLFTVHSGEPENRHLSSEYLAVLETDQATPYFLNLHHQDVAHSLIVGATGAGKTTLLNALAGEIADEERIFIIEDTAEIRIHKPHVVSSEAQASTDKQAISFDILLKATLRHRPDRIILGEVRGVEARTLLDAMNTGHDGTLTTIHASSTEGALRRLAILAVRGSGQLTVRDAEEETRQSIGVVIQMTRRAGLRMVSDVLAPLSSRL